MSKTTSPEVNGTVAVGLDGKARLTPGQIAELAANRHREQLRRAARKAFKGMPWGKGYIAP